MNLDALIAWYQTLTPDSLDRLPEFYAADAHFVDPFNDVRGTAAIRTIFTHMFATLEAPRFVVHAAYTGSDGAMLRWQFHFGWRGKAVCIEGSSYLVFDSDGRAASHRDYWDSADLYRQLPVLGGVFKWLTGKMATPQG